MFKVRRKPIAAARKNAQDPDIMMEYFKTYTEVVDENGILPEDQWNFDETGYCMEMGREDWVVSVDIIRRIYSKYPDNRESLTVMECWKRYPAYNYFNRHTTTSPLVQQRLR